MDANEREAFYDAEIAPVLKDLAKKCQDNGLSLVAQVEWEPGETGRTVAIVEKSSFGIRMAEAAMRSNGNVDAFLLGVTKYAQEHGHSSMFLNLLNVPTTPKASAP
ncbi:hypothetical protein ACRQ5Q_15280 [Bradyrhizobium sp. PMVTL-01]|uniref:hypothetical protein n=1 Tax=Bradyrhizobium sp. PMVTL-01 TaxID=3434999 RepID=UPI003F711271